MQNYRIEMLAGEPQRSGVIRPTGFQNRLRIDRWGWLMMGVLGLLVLLTFGWPDPFWRMLRFLADGLWITVSITAVAFVLIVFVGLLGALGRVSPNPVLRSLTALYVDVVRGIPLLVQLLFLYYAFPQVLNLLGALIQTRVPAWAALGRALTGVQLSPFWSAVAGLAFCYGAYMTEVFRGGIEAVHYGQLEAALALGMTRRQAMQHIILPQALRVALPPIGNDLISLLKDSSLVSVVAVADLTRRGREFISTAFIPLEGWMMVALLYLALTLLLSRVVALIERHTALPGRD